MTPDFSKKLRKLFPNGLMSPNWNIFTTTCSLTFRKFSTISKSLEQRQCILKHWRFLLKTYINRYIALVVQRIGRKIADLVIEVRLLSRAPISNVRRTPQKI